MTRNSPNGVPGKVGCSTHISGFPTTSTTSAFHIIVGTGKDSDPYRPVDGRQQPRKEPFEREEPASLHSTDPFMPL
jgi:hypothetical protein